MLPVGGVYHLERIVAGLGGVVDGFVLSTTYVVGAVIYWSVIDGTSLRLADRNRWNWSENTGKGREAEGGGRFRLS